MALRVRPLGDRRTARRRGVRGVEAQTEVRRSRQRTLRVDHDRRHHATILVGQEVTVVDELADDGRVGERDHDLDRPVDGQVDDVLVADERLRHAVHLGHLEVRLMYVKVVQLARLVPDGPLFNGAQLYARVDPALVARPAVDEARVAVGSFREDDGATARDGAAQIAYR